MESIKDDVSKLHGIYHIVKDLNESDHFEEDITWVIGFVSDIPISWFCFWLLLKKAPHWAEFGNNSVRTPECLKKKPLANALGVISNFAMESEVTEESTHSGSVTCQPHTSSTKKTKRPPNVNQRKKDLRNVKTHEEASHAQAQASLEMVRATCLTTQTLQDATT